MAIPPVTPGRMTTALSLSLTASMRFMWASVTSWAESSPALILSANSVALKFVTPALDCCSCRRISSADNFLLTKTKTRAFLNQWLAVTSKIDSPLVTSCDLLGVYPYAHLNVFFLVRPQRTPFRKVRAGYTITIDNVNSCVLRDLQKPVIEV